MNNTPVTVGEWIITFLITGIPVVGLIMLFVWAFGSQANLSKSNYAKAVLIVGAICMVLGIIWSVVLGASFSSAFGDISY